MFGFKVLLVSVAVVCCGAQLNIPKNLKLADLGVPAPLVEAPVAIQEEAIAVAPAPAVSSLVQPVGQVQLLRGYQQLGSHFQTPIHHFRTQEVLPVQDIDNEGQILNLRADNQPVLVRFQTQSAPVHVETSHIPTPQEEVAVTQHQDEPHRVIHEVIRPVIQEIREIIQPYRRITQEIRPVKEEVHTDVAAGGPAAVAAPIAVSAPVPAVAPAPVQTVVAAPAPTVVRAQAPAYVSAPAQAVYGNQLQYAYASPVQGVARSNLGVIAAPSPLYTGSYIQSFIEQLRARQSQGGLVLVSQPNQQQILVANQQPVVDSVAVEPVAAEAVAVAPAPVATQKLVAINRGNLQISRKYAEY